MHDFAGEGFQKRHPRAKKKIARQPLTAVGPDEEWSMDGHDKLNRAGFGIYGIREKWTGRYHHYRVLPSNRYAAVIGVVFLECAKKRGGAYSIFSFQFLPNVIMKESQFKDRVIEVQKPAMLSHFRKHYGA
jgi:hypothetical protein